MSENLERAKLLYLEIKKILMDEWDPIGVQNIIEAQDEYDSYLPSIHRMLVLRKSVHEMFEYLWWVETEHMGLMGDRQRTESIAKKLCSLIDQCE